jgi:outer membrane receptor protein involved in Fe transport
LHSTSSISRLAALVLLLVAVATRAAAQVPDSAKADSAYVLPPIEVVGTIAPFAGPKIGSGIPARVTTLDFSQVDAIEPRLLSDVLQQLAGFSAYDDLGSAYKLNLSTRGFFASPVVGLPQGVSVFLDGVRMNEPDAAEVNFDLLPLEHIKRIEVLSGNGTLLGRNSLGGAVNLVTRRGEGPLNGELELVGGTYGMLSGEGSVGGRSRTGYDYYVGGGYNTEDGWRQQTGSDQWNIFGNFGKLGATSGLRLQSFYASSYARTAGSLPESVYDVKPDSNLTTGDYEDLTSVQLALLGYRQLGNGRGSMNLYYRASNGERYNVNQAADPDALGQNRNRTFGGTIDYRFAVPIGSRALGLRFGVDGSTSSTSVKLFADSTKFGGGETQTTWVESPVWDLAGFGLADYTVGRTTLSGGLRLDHVSGPFYNKLDPSRDTTQTWTRLNPRVGVDVDAGRGLSVFVSWGQAFRAPSVIEVACADPEEPCPLPFALGDDPPIDAVVATTWEAGLRYAHGGLALSGSAYWTNVANDIFLFPYQNENEPEGSTIDGYFANVPKTRRQGVELNGTYAFGPGHRAYLNYAWTRATFQSEVEVFSIREEFGGENTTEPGDQFPLVPEHQVKGGLSLRFPVGLRAGLDARWIGSQYLRGDEANETAPLPDYFVADVRAGWEFGPWEIIGQVTNVLNAKYATFGAYNINQGSPLGPTLERFYTPGYVRQLRLIVTRAFGPDRD